MEQQFEEVSLSEFFDNNQLLEPEDSGIIVFTEKQKSLLDKVLPSLKEADHVKYDALKSRLQDLQSLAASIARFPSLLERHALSTGERTPSALIDSLIQHQNEGDSTLQLPSKAALGKSFLITKIHTFSSLSKIARNINLDDSLVQEISTETVTMMYSLLAEDVYLNYVCDRTIDTELRQEMAMSLLLLWEHRADQTIADIAPVLQLIWQARRKLAPAFGTMMGTSELLLISIQMDDMWAHFIKEKLGDNGISQAMEEFLFGISYEQIDQLRSILRTKGIMAIGRDEVSKFLGVHVKTDAGLDYRDFYSMYTLRRDNARARARMNLPGPKKTLEDYFIQFVMLKNKEKQKNDAFAK